LLQEIQDFGMGNSVRGQPFLDFKAEQRLLLDNAACGWQACWETIEHGAQKVSDKMVELSEIKPGDKVLDIATDIGEPAISAARKVVPNGNVIAIHVSPQMLAIAKTRATLFDLAFSTVRKNIKTLAPPCDAP
jgi:cyclopropane fatty-acyl-phospholipid synthase-like methyltransferase